MAMFITLLVTTASAITPGLWQVRTLAHGAADPVITVHCIPSTGDWVRPVLPPAIVANCVRADWNGPGTAKCSPSGGLSLTGTISPDRFDMVAHRYGRVAANPRADAIFHIEGRRIAPTAIGSRCR